VVPTEPETVNADGDPVLDEAISTLRSKIDRVQSDNESLRDKITNTGTSVHSYISEMSGLIDTPEINSLLG